MISSQKILLTGGAGYIGSHTYVALHEAGFYPIILDDFSNSSPDVIDRLALISNRHVEVERGDVGNRQWVKDVLIKHNITGAVHFAAFKSVGDSVERPLQYFSNNVGGLMSVLQAMSEVGCKQFVYSSSATVYGMPSHSPITEDFPLCAINPYGATKVMGENILDSLKVSDPAWRIATLRYFNPVGAHTSSLIGEAPSGRPNNLMPFIAEVAAGVRSELQVFGDDYPTRDGTGVRDYIHVMDLAESHVAALQYLQSSNKSITVNVGTGHGYSVLEVIRAYERACGRPIPYRVSQRRNGDIAECYADTALASNLLSWQAKRSLDDMCESSWVWQRSRPR